MRAAFRVGELILSGMFINSLLGVLSDVVSRHRILHSLTFATMNNQVQRSKLCFLSGMVLTAAVSAVISGFMVAKSETKTFEDKVRSCCSQSPDQLTNADFLLVYDLCT